MRADCRDMDSGYQFIPSGQPSVITPLGTCKMGAAPRTFKKNRLNARSGSPRDPRLHANKLKKKICICIYIYYMMYLKLTVFAICPQCYKTLLRTKLHVLRTLYVLTPLQVSKICSINGCIF
ncbi:unnamed protein product [Chrysodeixis includens]|uniref:Uncharacterized protein n=1 Tax=Chrysodeixis includens TaxID=689277 RepID=A0A9N8KP45_CHRIL|nr:unnamed protein product [Chrysodeixis includens]